MTVGGDDHCVRVGVSDDVQGNDSAPLLEEGGQGGTAGWGSTVINSFNILIGASLLSLPYAFAKGGWWAAGILVGLAIASDYTANLLGKIQHLHPEAKNYPDMGVLAFGTAGHWFLQIVFFGELFLYMIGIIILLAENAYKLNDSLTKREWMLVWAAAVMPTALVRDFSKLTFVSVLGSLAGAFLLGALVYIGVHEDLLTTNRAKDQSNFVYSTFPFGVGLLMSLYGGHSIYPAIRSQMKEKSGYPSMVHLTFTLSTLFYIVFGFLGYRMYGADVNEVITLSFDESNPVSKVGIVLIIVLVYAKYGLLNNAIATPFEEGLQARLCPDASPYPIYMLTRVAMTAGALGMAIAIPGFATAMGVMGSAMTLCISIIFPLLAYNQIFAEKIGQGQRAFNVVLACVGIVAAVLGTFAAVGGKL
eukprot:Hpha_TRINITY_DN2081_c0_g1::TRINITY_DN2081_c0_g1_i1::g.82884::m.82884/K15015/SLC32A, VGAT; solute carrier family 32 (vesicular inhibitory amino acid transporter)